MLNIFVLEDSIIQQSRMETALRQILRSHKWAYKNLFITGKPDQLLTAIKEKGPHQVFFLDIDIRGQEQKGLEIAQIIRDRDPSAHIVFVTSHSEMMPLSFRYKVSAMDFIPKELEELDFEKRLTEVLAYTQSKMSPITTDFFSFETPHAHIQVPFADVIYIETIPQSHKLGLYTSKECLFFTANIADIIQKEPRLYACHRSIIVNPLHVTRLEKSKNIAHMSNGADCIVSRRRMAGLAQAIEKLGGQV